jgi:hypothetical protein
MLNNPNALLSKAEWCSYCIRLRIFSLIHFKMVEAMRLKIIASRFPSMALP